MPNYTPPVMDMQFVLHDVLQISKTGIPGYEELERDFTEAVLGEAGRLAAEVLAPLNAVGDRQGCRLGKRRGPDARWLQGRLRPDARGRLDRHRRRA